MLNTPRLGEKNNTKILHGIYLGMHACAHNVNTWHDVWLTCGTMHWQHMAQHMTARMALH